SGNGAPGRAPAWSDPYRMLDSALTAELESAQALYEVGMRTPVGRVACGAMMLAHMGLADAARAKVEAALQSKPDSRTLSRLRDMLMPHSAVAVLVAQRKPEAALAAIGELPPEQQRTPEVLALRAQALQLLARQKAGMDRMNEAMADWKAALDLAGQAGREQLALEIRSEIAATCHSKAAAMGDYQREAAIDLLERAHKLAPDEKLKLTLAALLLRRGIETFVKAQERLARDKDLTDEIITAFDNGRKDLERARTLGSKDAIEQARLARSFLGEALTARGIGKINEAQMRARNNGAITHATVSALQSGLEDLERAEQLGNTKAAEQVRVAREVLAQARLILAGGGQLARQSAPASSKGTGCASVIASAILLVALGLLVGAML
ncbi:MAG TPA: hypothetical protein VD902_07785, partial [Symbiobacteriaceae bacterium]|nr:hypothetical protein [Symbiobacteriaceae bacterium]